MKGTGGMNRGRPRKRKQQGTVFSTKKGRKKGWSESVGGGKCHVPSQKSKCPR